MVFKGQFLERPAIIRVEKIVLEGLAHRGQRRPPLLILSPPPEEGGGMDYPVAAEIAWRAATSNHATLRFNYRGVGASQGKVSAKTHLGDALAAFDFLQETYPNPAVVSLGASAALLSGMALKRKLAGIAAVSPATVDEQMLGQWAPKFLVLLGEYDLRIRRATLAGAIADAGGQFELIAGADRHFTRNLAQVGKCIADWLGRLETVKNDKTSST